MESSSFIQTRQTFEQSLIFLLIRPTASGRDHSSASRRAIRSAIARDAGNRSRSRDNDPKQIRFASRTTLR
jgi:hypothetical protein